MARKEKVKKEKINKWKLPKEEAKIQAREKRIRRSFRVTRLRALKNTLYWLFGVLSSIGIVAGAVFIGVGVVPISTLVGKDTVSEYVSSNVYDKSIINAILGLEGYTFEDFPIIEKSLKDALGDGNEISAFNDYQKVKKLPVINASYKLEEDSAIPAKNYYYAEPVTGSGGEGALSDEPVAQEFTYHRAFDDNGVLLEIPKEKFIKGELELYLPPLFDLPLVEGLASISTYLDYVKVSDILKIAGVGEGTLVHDIMDGVYIGDFMTPTDEGGFSADTILNNVSLETLGGADMLGDLGNFKFFKEYEKVLAENYPTVELRESKEYITKTESEGEETKFSSEPSQYYIELVAPVPATNETPAVDGEYARAFTDDGEFITQYTLANGETKTYASLAEVECDEGGKLCYANLSQISFSTALSLIGDSILRQDIVGLVSSFGMDIEEDSLIKKLFDGETIESFGKSPEEGGFDFEAIKLSAMLGDYDEKDDGGNFKNKEFYDTLLAITGDKPLREDGESDESYDARVKEAAEKLTVSSLTSEFSLDSVKIGDILDGLDDKTLNLLCSSVNATKKAEFEANPENQGQEYVPVTKDTLSVGDFEHFKVDNIKLSDVLDPPTTENPDQNKTIYDILLNATRPDGVNKEDWTIEDITVNALSKFELNNVQLTAVLPYEEETANSAGTAKLYEILLDVTRPDGVDKEDWTVDDIYISHLKSFETNNILLSSVLKISENEKLYEILVSAIPSTQEKTTEATNITLGDLSRFETDNIKLKSVLEYKEPNGTDKGTRTIYEIILSTKGQKIPDRSDNKYNVPNGDALYQADLDAVIDSVTVKSFDGLDIDEVNLTVVLPNDAEHTDLYKILLDVTRPANLGASEPWTAEDIKIKHLTNFKTDNIKLTSVLEYTEPTGDDKGTKELYEIILSAQKPSLMPSRSDYAEGAQGEQEYNEAIKAAAESVKLSQLKGLDIDEVKLNVVLPNDEGTKDLYDILVDVTRPTDLGASEPWTAEDIKIKNLKSFKTDNIKLSSVLELPSVNSDNETIYKILLEATQADSYEEIKISSLSDFKTEKIRLVNVLPYEVADEQAGTAGTEMLYNVLMDVTNETDYTKITLESLSNFNTEDIKLSTVLGVGKKTGNSILDSLIAKEVSVGNISSAINGMTLYEIYGENCFVTDMPSGYTGEKFSAIEDGNGKITAFERDDVNGTYYLSPSSGIWLMLCFDTTDYSASDLANSDCANYAAHGKPKTYIPSTMTMEQLQNNGSTVAQKVMKAKIGLLIEAGIVSEPNGGFANELIYTLDIAGVIDTLGNINSALIPGLGN